MRIFACRFLVIAALSALELFCLSPASAEQLVKFDSAAPPLLQGEEPGGPSTHPHIQGYLTKPPGEGPFPAVVLLHSCLGLPANRQSIANTFATWGYVALFVDDFTTRGIKETCAVDFSAGVSDAFGALRYLSGLRYVDPSRIAAVGYSQGADTALTVASSRSGLPKFKVAAALYPPCANQGAARLEVPTLILVGESDDVTPAADCERLAAKQPGDRSNVKLVVYPGAHHGFDNPSFADGMRLYGMWLEYDHDAAKQSLSELRNFLATKLAR